MTRPSRSSSSPLEEMTFTGRIISKTPSDGRRLETCEIMMKVSIPTNCIIVNTCKYTVFTPY